MKLQQRSESYRIEADAMNLTTREMGRHTASTSGMVRVCRMSLVEEGRAQPTEPVEIGNVICDKLAEADKIWNGEIKPQTRELSMMVPTMDRKELDNPVTEEINLTKYLMKTFDEYDDMMCDTRKCRVCKMNFENHYKEAKHRETREHVMAMEVAAEQEVWKCHCCNFTVINTKKKDDEINFDDHDSKRKSIRHLKSKEHE